MASINPAETGAEETGGKVFTPSGAADGGFMLASRYVRSMARKMETWRGSIGQRINCAYAKISEWLIGFGPAA
ncbi:hypothetical protein FY134_04580 [Agrobacterium fabrum]|uniref:hypothetical protein n=1 Tax=Agrobacterium fabrum TaxID=1176649 RepID=UPI0021CEF2E0|nr:hypothetical protein [Agrobacterium fabrum]UXT56964.1 hypothetical protein FY134_04580 [Agrobacterium fabrum]